MKRDPNTLKLFVLVILLLDGFHTILCTYALYWYLILNFGDLGSLEYNMWAMNVCNFWHCVSSPHGH
jgi:hypothetical protein